MADDGLTDAEIAALVARHPLPEGVPDAVLNREELAEALGASLNTVTAWINAGMPVSETGRNGKPYELKLSHCFAWNEARKHSEELRSDNARTAIAAMRLALVGGRSGDSIEALDPKQRRDILTAQLAHEQLEAERNRLLKREDVRELLEAVFALVRDTLDSAPDRIEREEPTLTPKAVNALVEICDGIADEMARKMEAFWTARPERGHEFMKEELFDA
jgi:phage terminase Nu1 subunit (DNA packaging protein)